jgi:hypothetical protein
MCPVGDWRLRRGVSCAERQCPLNSRKTLFYMCALLFSETGRSAVVGRVAPKKHAADFS